MEQQKRGGGSGRPGMGGGGGMGGMGSGSGYGGQGGFMPSSSGGFESRFGGKFKTDFKPDQSIHIPTATGLH